MTTHVTEKGSPYDLAAMYTALTDTLQRLSKMKPISVDETLSIVYFKATTSSVETLKLGILNDGNKVSKLKLFVTETSFKMVSGLSQK